MSAPTTEIPPASEPELEGQLVGEYRVEGKLGQGAFGTVYKAVHPVIGKVAAIKVLSRRFSVDPDMVRRFVDEARAVNQIRHRSIIDIFSFGQLEDGRHYYVMEYLDGETLDARLAREHRIALADSFAILRAIGRALDAAHAKGIAHRDLKAENVFLASDPDAGISPKLLDFGIAKLINADEGLKSKTKTGMSIGTPYYMSPEQCHGRQVDHRTDIYAFGVLVYLMLTGVYPFEGDDYMAILMKQVGEQPRAPSVHVPELPEGIDDVVLWLMQKDPAARPPDLKTAVLALEQAAERAGLITAVPMTSAWEAVGPAPSGPVNVPKVSSGHRSVAPETAMVSATGVRWKPLLAIALVVAVGAGAAIVVAMYPRGEEPAPPAPAPVAAPTPTPAPVPAPAPAPGPALVTLTITGTPKDTEVALAGRVVGMAPGEVQLLRSDAPVVLTLHADGYIVTTTKVTPDQDRRLDVPLRKKPAVRHTTKDDIEEAFPGSNR